MTKETIMILVVDDRPGPRSDLRWAVEKEGRQVLEACDIAQAVRLIAEHDFHIVVTDIWLKDQRMGGLDVLRAAKKKDPLTQVILVTAFGQTEEGPKIGVHAMLEGAFDYIESNIAGVDYLKLVGPKVDLALNFRQIKQRQHLSHQ
jgi:DNA-binding NtrC family response regulator